MDPMETMGVTGPMKRKSMHNGRRQTKRKNDIIANSAELTDDEHYIREGSVNRVPYYHFQDQLIDSQESLSNPSYEDPFIREGSVNRTQNARPQESLIDSDDSHSDVNTDDMEDPVETNRSYSPYKEESLKTPHSTNSGDAPENGTGCVGIVFLIAIVILLVALYFSGNSSKTNELDAIEKLQNSYSKMDPQFWDILRVNINRATTTHKSPEPGVILFLQYGSTAKFKDFIARVAKTTASHFGNVDPIVLKGEDLKQSDIQNDYGVFLAQQKEALRRHGVMVVRNLEDVPATAAQAFHVLCDTQEPLVDRAIILLTLDMTRAAKVNKPSNQSATAEAERVLRELWKNSLQPEVLDPLITRLTDNVYRLFL